MIKNCCAPNEGRMCFVSESARILHHNGHSEFIIYWLESVVRDKLVGKFSSTCGDLSIIASHFSTKGHWIPFELSSPVLFCLLTRLSLERFDVLAWSDFCWTCPCRLCSLVVAVGLLWLYVYTWLCWEHNYLIEYACSRQCYFLDIMTEDGRRHLKTACKCCTNIKNVFIG